MRAARCEISEACRGRGRDQAACRAIFVRLKNTRSVAIPKQGRALPKAHSKRRERHHKETDDLRAQLRCCQKVSRPGPTCSTGRANVKSTADAYTKSSVSRRRRRPWASTFLRSRRMASLARFFSSLYGENPPQTYMYAAACTPCTNSVINLFAMHFEPTIHIDI